MHLGIIYLKNAHYILLELLVAIRNIRTFVANVWNKYLEKMLRYRNFTIVCGYLKVFRNSKRKLKHILESALWL